MDTSLSRKAYEHIQAKLLSGELRGGSLISENGIAAEIGISRTPVREALHKMEMEGIVETVPRYGTLVRGPDQDEMLELFDLREALEAHAARQAASRLVAEDQDLLHLLVLDMRECVRQFQESKAEFLVGEGLKRFIAADMGFHMTIIRSLNNRRFMKIIDDFRVIRGIFGYFRMGHDAKILEQSCLQHENILDLLTSGQSDAAGAAMAAHIRASKKNWLDGNAAASARGALRGRLLALPADLMRDIESLPTLRASNGDGDH
ncbi:MAG: GntR family transcriptional regulator [Capsulimonadaceae bacterium]|nr:GntR family transcriptional regulator [Capsulimonadaceae bacterium]